MPSRIQRLATQATQDRRITVAEADQIAKEALANKKLSSHEKQVLSSLLRNKPDAFDPGAREKLQAALTGTTAPTARPPEKDLADPAVLREHAGSARFVEVADGQLYVNGLSHDDVVQGQIGNCYMVAAFSAVANARPDAIQNAIKDNQDGTYTVRFYEHQADGSTKEVHVTVDDDVASKNRGALYGSAREAKELWVPVLEKAFAQWKGSYDAIGAGGMPDEVMAAITGNKPDYMGTNPPEAIFAYLQHYQEQKIPMVAATHADGGPVDYNNTGIYGSHAYTILGVSEENGQKYVQLRNPWGQVEPGNDGKDDGIFKMKLEDFSRLYHFVSVG